VTERLVARDIEVRFGGRAVLEGLGVALEPGTLTVLVGPNGAGKSTLLSCLAGLRPPDTGEVALGGRALHRLKARERAQRIGYLPQTPEIAWRLDVETFVSLGRTAHRGLFGHDEEDARAVADALEQAGLQAFAQRDVTTLSGGERARVLMARALAGRPAWLLADEPMTGLDPGHQMDAAVVLRRLADAGVGVIATLHDLSFAARIADRLIVLADGRIIADGAPGAALNAAVIAKAYGLEARWIAGRGGALLDVIGRTRPDSHD